MRRKFVFIVTYGRSGSTLLQSLLSTIPKSHIMGENLDTLAGLFESYRNAEQAKREQGIFPRDKPGDPWRGAHLVDVDRYNRELARVFVNEILRPPRDAKVVGFKEIRYFEHDNLEAYLDYMRSTFRPCLLVFNRRDAEATAASARRNRPHRTNSSAEAIRRFDRRVDAYRLLHSEDCVVVSYDDYIRDVRTLAPLFARLRARIDQAALERVLSVHLEH